jgi:hypothetical protein
MPGLQDFASSVLIKVISDESVQASVKKLLGSIIAEQILPLVPVAVGAATKAAIDEVLKKFPGAGDLIEGAVDIVHTTDAARNELNALLPDIDFGIPALDNLLDFWRPKN